MIAVCRPLSGVAPEAIASAIASGNATIATVSPAIRSWRRSSTRVARRNSVNSFGTYRCQGNRAAALGSTWLPDVTARSCLIAMQRADGVDYSRAWVSKRRQSV